MIGKVVPGSTTPVFLEAESHLWFHLQVLPACLEATSVGLISGDQQISVAGLIPLALGKTSLTLPEMPRASLWAVSDPEAR